MSELSTGAEYEDHEKAYLENGGVIPAASDEPKPKPEDQPAGDEPPAEPQEPDDDGSDADEPEAEAQAEGERKPRKVNYGAFVKQKKEAAEAKRQYDELRQRYENDTRQFVDFRARAEERLRALAPQPQPQQQAPKAPTPPPDLNDDPMGYIRWQAEQMQSMQERLVQTEQGFHQNAEHQRQTQAIAQLDHAYRSDNRAAAKEMPEYPSAYNFMVDRAKQIIRIQNPNMPPEQIDQAVEMQERQLAAAAYQRGQRPAAMIVQMAQTYGWQPNAQQPVAAQADPAAEQARLDAAQRGQRANLSLSGTGRSGSMPGAMTVDKLVDMPNEEFAAWVSKNPDKWARMQGVN